MYLLSWDAILRDVCGEKKELTEPVKGRHVNSCIGWLHSVVSNFII